MEGLSMESLRVEVRNRSQKILCRMDDCETYMNVNFTKTDSRSPSGDEPDVSYAELNFKPLSEPLDRAVQGGLNSTYSELNFGKEEPRIHEEDDSPISSVPGGLSNPARTGPQKQEPKENIGNRPDPKICLLCLVAFALVAIVAGLSIHVSQTHQSLITSEQDCRRLREQHQEMNRTQRQYEQQILELNSTLESRTSENSRLDLSQRTCLKNLSALNNNLTILENSISVLNHNLTNLENNISVLSNNLTNLENNISVLNTDLLRLNQTHSDLGQQFKQLEVKYRSINKTKAQICQYLTRRRDQTCSQNWIKNEDRCYFISNNTDTYDGARQQCSELDSRLVEINSEEEKNFVNKAIRNQGHSNWIGKCKDGKVASNVMFRIYRGEHECGVCTWQSESKHCDQVRTRFICEKSAPSCQDFPEKIQDLCQQTVGPT